jgi:predicted dehydrogenase
MVHGFWIVDHGIHPIDMALYSFTFIHSKRIVAITMRISNVLF